MSEWHSVESLFDWFEHEVGDIDILVNCAGLNVDRSIDRLSGTGIC